MEQRGEQVYNLKLEMLLKVLNANRQTCQIRAEVALGTLLVATGNGKADRGREKLVCVIEVSLQHGHVVSATIHDSIGRRLAVGDQALLSVRQCGDLSWIVRPTHAPHQELSSAQPFTQSFLAESGERRSAPDVWFGRSPPCLTHRPRQEEIDTLSRKSRQVLLLIDGKRGISEICRIFDCTSDQLTPAFDELIAKKLIFFRTRHQHKHSN
jgi:hypothetical protein